MRPLSLLLLAAALVATSVAAAARLPGVKTPRGHGLFLSRESYRLW